MHSSMLGGMCSVDGAMATSAIVRRRDLNASSNESRILSISLVEPDMLLSGLFGSIMDKRSVSRPATRYENISRGFI